MNVTVLTAPTAVSNWQRVGWILRIAERVTPQRAFQERLASPTVHVDDDIAVVWAAFVVRIGGVVSNCGIDHFDLVRERSVWKVMNLTFSSRATGCPAR